MIRYVLGIDCGVNTGFALWDCTEKKLIVVKTYSAHEAWSAVRHLTHVYGKDAVFIRFEDARLRKWFGDAGREQLQGAGSIKRDSTLWEDFCKIEGIAYEAVAPKRNKTKTTAEYFKRVTGWQKATNEHSRDAGMMVFQFSPLKAK